MLLLQSHNARSNTICSPQGRIRLILQVVSEILKVLQKLLKHFNSTTILMFLALPSAGVFLVIFALNLKDTEFVMLSSFVVFS